MRGKFVFPAFEESHSHPSSRCRILRELDCSNNDSWESAREAMQEYALTFPQREIIVVHGWNTATWGTPSREACNKVIDRPLILLNVSYHGALVNDSARALLRQKGWQPQHDDHVVSEEDIVHVTRLTLPGREDLKKALEVYLQRLIALGVAAVHDMHISSREQLLAYTELDQEQALPIDVIAYMNPMLLDDAESMTLARQRGRRFSVGGVKLFLDGAIGMRTAEVSQAYRGDKGSRNRGVANYSDIELDAIAEQALEKGFSTLAFHAIGDVAVHRALAAATRFQKKGVDISSWRIEHAELMDVSALEALEKLHIWPVIQPAFVTDVKNYGERLGDLVELVNPIAELVKRDIRFAFGSDGMPEGPMVGIDYAVNGGYFEQQKVTAEEALYAYTTAGALLAGAAEKRGSLEVGKQANFIVTGKNLLTEPSVRAIPLEEVWLRGTKYALPDFAA